MVTNLTEMKKCFICGEPIDKSACGEEWGTFTQTTDDGDRHRKTKIVCGLHSIAVDLYIQNLALNNEQRKQMEIEEIKEQQVKRRLRRRFK